MASGIPSFKVVLVGDAQVGKSSVLGQWARNEYLNYYEPTVSPELTTKEVTFQGQTARLQVWDIGFGEPETVAQFPSFARGAAGVLLMYDLSDPSSVDGVDHWREQVRSLTGPSSVFVVVGCKSDLRTVPGVAQKARNLCDSFGMQHVETSAHLCSNIASVFETLAFELLRQTDGLFESSVKAVMAPTPAVLSSPSAPYAPAMPPDKLAATAPPQNGNSGGAGKAVKLVLLGEPRVGKTCLAQHLGGGEGFESEYIPTAGPEMLTQQKNVNGMPVRVQVWDVSGEDLMENTRICGVILQGCSAAVVLYDISSRATFESVGRWFRLLEEQGDADVAAMLVGHKADQTATRAISINEGLKLAESVGIPFAEVSSRTGTGIDRILDTMLAGGRAAPDWSAAICEASTSVAAMETTSPAKPRRSPAASPAPSPAPSPAVAAKQPARRPSGQGPPPPQNIRGAGLAQTLPGDRGAGLAQTLPGDRSRAKVESSLKERHDRMGLDRMVESSLKERNDRNQFTENSIKERLDRVRDGVGNYPRSGPTSEEGSPIMHEVEPQPSHVIRPPGPREVETKIRSPGNREVEPKALSSPTAKSVAPMGYPFDTVARRPPRQKDAESESVMSGRSAPKGDRMGNSDLFNPFPTLSKTSPGYLLHQNQAPEPAAPSAYGNVMGLDPDSGRRTPASEQGVAVPSAPQAPGNLTPKRGQGPLRFTTAPPSGGMGQNQHPRSPSSQALRQTTPMPTPQSSPIPVEVEPLFQRDPIAQTDPLGRSQAYRLGSAQTGPPGSANTGYPGSSRPAPSSMQQRNLAGQNLPGQGLRGARPGMGPTAQTAGMQRTGGARMSSSPQPTPQPTDRAPDRGPIQLQASNQQPVRPSIGGRHHHSPRRTGPTTSGGYASRAFR